MKKQKRNKTVGAIATDLLKSADNQHTVVEQMNEQLSEWDEGIYTCVENHKKLWPNKDFYIEVQTKAERLLVNTFRCYYIGKQACPTPTYDQTVYKYDHKSDIVEFIWVIPSQDACIYLKENAMQVVKEERHLLDFVLKFSDGTLWKLCKHLNGEVLWY